MAKVTPGNRLYFYQLFSQQIGTGKQVPLARVEEVLDAEDIWLEDVECATTQELLEALGDIVRITVFKKGRVYMTLQKNADLDAILARAGQQTEKKAATGAKSFKHKKSSKDPKPAKPRHRRPVKRTAEPEAVEAVAEPEASVLSEVVAEVEAVTVAEAVAAEERVADATVAAAEEPQVTSTPTLLEQIEAQLSLEPEGMAQEASQAVEEVATEPQAEPAQQSAVEVAAPAPDPTPAPVPAPVPTPSITFNITYNPYEDEEIDDSAPEEEPQQQEELFSPAPAPVADAAPQDLQKDLPQHFSADVSCKDAVLRMLYQMLPPSVEPMAILDEDWRVARSTGSVGGNRSRVTFPLRFLREDGSTPIEVTLRRSTKSASGKRWSLVLVDGDDGTGQAHEGISLEGLPKADEGAWSDLSVVSSWDTTPANPLLQLAETMALGSWESFLGALATMAAPEKWDYPSEGVGKASRYGILREYVTVTVSRILAEGKLSVAPDGSLAAFNTGLITSFAEDIYAVLTPRKGDIPWQFAGFCTAGSGELGTRLLACIDPLPEAASYLSGLSDITPQQGRMVVLDSEALVGRMLGRLPRAWLKEQLAGSPEASALLAEAAAASTPEASQKLASLTRALKADPGLHRRIVSALDDACRLSLRRARASYRLCAPVWDPVDGKTKLLLPLCLVDDTSVDCALVLNRQPSGNYLAAAILPLERAYACARVVSAEQPTWLASARVL